MLENKPYELYKGDCLEVMHSLIQKKVKVDAIICDPPYGTTQCKWDSVIPFTEMWNKLKLLRHDNTPILLFGSEPFSSMLRCSNLKEYKYDWIWEKSKATGFLNAKRQPLRANELICVFYKKQPMYNPQMTAGESYNKGIRKKQTEDDVYGNFNQVEVKSDGLRYPRTVQYFKTAESEGATFHKTQKPIALLEYLIKTYTHENDIVLDFTMGSGSTGVACINTGRKFIGIELNDTYFEIAEKRIAENLVNTTFQESN